MDINEDVHVTLFYFSGSGVQWDNIGKPVNIDDDFTILHCVLFLIFDIVFYSIITWYVDEVKPGQYGLPKPLYFPFTVSSLKLLPKKNMFLFSFLKFCLKFNATYYND